MGRTNTLSNGKNTLKEMTHGNLKKIYKMKAKSCRNIFRVYQKQDNFSMELEPRERVISQTLFSYISINSLTILTVLTIRLLNSKPELSQLLFVQQLTKRTR